MDFGPNQLSPTEQMEILLTGCLDLNWKIADSEFEAINPVLNVRFRIDRFTEEKLHIFSDPLISYRFTIILGTGIDSQYSTFKTGDYSNECDRLLKQLYKKAMQEAQTSIFGHEPVSIR